MNSFRTIELSDAAYEKDGLRFLTVKTPNLAGRGDICLFVPEVSVNVKDLPIYILLHGVYGSAWIWALKGGAHHMAKRLMDNGDIHPAIIAMPSDGLWGDGSAYLTHHNKDFAKWIVSDVPSAIIENILPCTSRSPMGIGGLSMGGYGAMMLGAQYPDKFKAISAHSALTRFEEIALFVEEPLESYHITSSAKNVIDVIKKHPHKMPAMRFDCGLNDNLLTANRILHHELMDIGVAHIYEEFIGGHEWSYWQKHLELTLRFFDNQMDSGNLGKDL